MCSTFKASLAAFVLARADNGEDRLARPATTGCAAACPRIGRSATRPATTARMRPATLPLPGPTPAARCWFAPTPRAAHRPQNNSKPSLRKSDGWQAGNWARRVLVNPGIARPAACRLYPRKYTSVSRGRGRCVAASNALRIAHDLSMQRVEPCRQNWMVVRRGKNIIDQRVRENADGERGAPRHRCAPRMPRS